MSPSMLGVEKKQVLRATTMIQISSSERGKRRTISEGSTGEMQKEGESSR